MNNTIGCRIAAARCEKGYNQSALARMIGVTAQCVQTWEKDTTRPRGCNLSKLADALMVTEQYILFGTNNEISDLYSSTQFQQDYVESVEKLFSAGIEMGLLDGKSKQNIKALAQFGLQQMRTKQRAS